ncbi:MAG TPA: polysaccharide deacetylase family protein [Puia sp.]|nr:polysaccharide deacetylase family protein [Puia sp.]
MLTTHPDQIHGMDLSPKTLCLTFDDGPGETIGDGPGPKTLKLAQYLREEGIVATFFAAGKHVEAHPRVLPEVIRLGHIVGNHSFDHPFMTRLYQHSSHECIMEITRTTNLIKNLVPDHTMFFRAPYGDWSPELSAVMNKELKDGMNYIGPIHWDINANDWACWDKGETPESCAEKYLREIEMVGRGIVVMHDSTSDNDNMKANNRTYETLRILVPPLKDAGYQFVAIDQIPGIKQQQ